MVMYQSGLKNAYNCVSYTPIKIQNIAIMPESSVLPHPSHPFPTRELLICYHHRLVFFISELHIKKTIQYVLFWAWHLSFSIMLIFYFYFIVVRAFNMRFSLLTDFKVYIQYIIVNYRYHITQEICRSYSSCLTETSYLLNSNFLFSSPSHPLATTIQLSALKVFDYFRYLK